MFLDLTVWKRVYEDVPFVLYVLYVITDFNVNLLTSAHYSTL